MYLCYNVTYIYIKFVSFCSFAIFGSILFCFEWHKYAEYFRFSFYSHCRRRRHFFSPILLQFLAYRMYRRRVHLQEICTPCRMTENCRTKRPAAHARLGSHVDNPPWPSVGMQSMQHSSICDNVTRAYALCVIIIPFLFLLLLLLPVAFRFHLCHPRSTSKCRLCSEFK